ncbi:MAG TPA: (d)CMP kinase [Gemmatimonadaceae bacterium]|nr:(d)CMP kinase [Gemmatimonadaceae bacterium]
MTSRDSLPNVRQGIVIAIDGPAASGKSSTAHRVAAKLGFHHIDSGALYRAATARALLLGDKPDSWTPTTVLDAARPISLIDSGREFAPALDGALLDAEIRRADVTANVSRVAQMQPVRDWVNALVREAASMRDVVVDGRDMGTAVFPDADLKVYLVADPWERARRRLIQTLSRNPNDDEIAVETERLVRRDAADATQSAAAKDAVLVDTTYVTQEEQVERIAALAASAIQHRARGRTPT